MTGASAPKSELRLDIQALRGFAVLLVVLYHAGINVLPAGNLGVDVFFVISGFLITSVIAKAIGRGDFSFREFYYRRAKRLLPAAYCVILATVALAPFFISDVAFEEMTAQVWGAVTFTANFVLWNQTGYFDGSAATKPFLHFWSLAIEEQYYLVMPLLLVLVPRRAWLPLFGAIVVVSALTSLWLAQTDPDTAFYWPHARAWELAIGSLLAIAPYSKIPLRLRSLARIPAIAILVAIPMFPTGFPHPGIDAMLVTVATAIVIAGMSGHAAERSRPVRALAFLGDFSYSLYLVHWPVIVFTRAAWLEHAPAWALYLAIAISVALSLVLYRLVEEPFRKGFGTNRKVLTAGLLATSVMVLLAPATVLAATSSDRDYAYVRRDNYGLGIQCTINDRRPFTGAPREGCRTQPVSRLIVWGDSYAMAWASVLMAPLHDFGLEQLTRAACDPLLGIARFSRARKGAYTRKIAIECISTHHAILDYVKANDAIETVAIGGRFSEIMSDNGLMLVETATGYDVEEPSIELAASGLARLVGELRDAGKKVVILAPPPADGSQIGDCLEREERGKVTFGRDGCELSMADVQAARASTWAMLTLAADLSDAPIVSMDGFLCTATICRTKIDGKFVYRDSGHLAYEGAAVIGEQSNLAEQVLRAAR